MKTTPPLGPAPTRAPAGGGVEEDPPLDAARRRVLRVVAESRPGVTVGMVADVVGGHPNSTRHHLRALVALGLLQTRTGGGSGPGRPPVRYALTEAGRRASGGTGAGDHSVEEYLALAGAFADRLAAHGGDPSGESRSVGRAWGAALARRDAGDADGDPRHRVMGLLDRLGFSPEPVAGSPGEASGGSPEVALRTCPLLDAARRHPEVVCEVHAGLVAGADATYGGTGDGVDLRPFAVPGACLLRLPPAG